MYSVRSETGPGQVIDVISFRTAGNHAQGKQYVLQKTLKELIDFINCKQAGLPLITNAPRASVLTLLNLYKMTTDTPPPPPILFGGSVGRSAN